MTAQTLENIAQDIARKTGAPIEVARIGLRVEAAKFAIAIGRMSIETANAYLADFGVQIVKAK
jgi:hypothetical protein